MPETGTDTGTDTATGVLRLGVRTPWYPGVRNPFSGTFVQHAVQAVQLDPATTVQAHVVHAEDWSAPRNRVVARAVTRYYQELAPGRLPERRVAEGRLLRVPVPARAGAGFAEHARGQVAAVAAALPRAQEVDVVHAHVGIYGGWVATALTPAGVPVVVTEHASFLDRVLAERAARDLYEQVVERASWVLCVSGRLRDQLVAAFPRAADRVVVVPNAIPFDRMPVRERPVDSLDRWLYVGRMVHGKGVERLLAAFATCASDRPRLRLTLVGGGKQADRFARTAADLGVAGRVTWLGAVAHERVVELMHEHDLLVHLSESETFGMTVVEAVASGLPVLTTRSGGPQETLAGLEGVAGTLVAVSDDTDEVVQAYRDLEGATLDLARARQVLRDRYGQLAVGRRLLDLYAAAREGSP